MKIGNAFLRVALGSLALLISACSKPAEEPVAATGAEPLPASSETPIAGVAGPRMVTTDQQASYGLGLGVGSNLAGQSVLEVDLDSLIAGIKDGLAAAEPKLDDATLQAAFSILDERAAAQAGQIAQANLAVAKDFLRRNAQRPGVIVTPSGLQYEVITASSDPLALKPTIADTVEVHYHGMLVDGTVFDSSIERGESISFPVAGVIPGWTEALQLMSVGDTWKLYVPPALGYGEAESGRIPPNSVLIFEVRLLRIPGKPAETGTAG